MMNLARPLLRTPVIFLAFTALLGTTMIDNARAEEAKAPVAVDKVRAFRDGDAFTAELQTTAAWNGTDVDVRYFRDSVQVDVQGAFLNKGKQLIKVEDRAFKSVYATQFDATTIRTRFTVKPGFTAKSFAGRVRVKQNVSSLTFEVTGDAQDAKAFTGKVSDEVNKVAVNADIGPEAIPAKLVAGAADAAATVAAAAVNAASGSTTSGTTGTATGGDDIAAALKTAKGETVALNGDVKADAASASEAAQKFDKKLDTNKLPENQIPVLSSATKEKKSESNPIFRLIMTLGVMAVVLGAAAFGVKKLANRQGPAAAKTRINVLTNHHLGPKKNLMIVQVAGETLLLGVTDHNITMLKTLALIDDEIPATVPQCFDHTMEDFIADEEEPIVMQGLDQIRDTVSSRLKNLRNL
jgi:flagellar protein FliO/FliZ